MTLTNKKITSKTTKAITIAGLILSLAISTSSAIPALAASAGYLGADMGSNVTELKGNVVVYSDLMSTSSQQLVSFMYATNANSAASSAFTVGVGYFGQGQTGTDLLKWASYYDQGTTVNNIVYLGGTVSSGTHAIQVTKSGTNWTTYGDGISLKTLSCPGSGCPSNFRFAGASTNSNVGVSSIIFSGSFSGLKVDAGGNDQNWATKATALKCDGSSGVSVTYVNANAVTLGEGSTLSCSDVAWGWLYNEGTGFFGVT